MLDPAFQDGNYTKQPEAGWRMRADVLQILATRAPEAMRRQFDQPMDVQASIASQEHGGGQVRLRRKRLDRCGCHSGRKVCHDPVREHVAAAAGFKPANVELINQTVREFMRVVTKDRRSIR